MTNLLTEDVEEEAVLLMMGCSLGAEHEQVNILESLVEKLNNPESLVK